MKEDQLSRIRVEENDDEHGRWHLFVDGIRVNQAHGFSGNGNEDDGRPVHIIFQLSDFDYSLALFDLVQLDALVTINGEPFGKVGWEAETLTVFKNKVAHTDMAVVEFSVDFNMYLWNRPYSLTQLKDELEDIFEGNPSITCRENDDVLFDMAIETSADVNKEMGDLIRELEGLMAQKLELAHVHLIDAGTSAVVTLFDFPAAVRPACEQYLVYFGQFLKDIGIDVSTEIKEKASKVLFTVTPIDRATALDTIRDALNAYLQIPGSPDAASHLASGTDIALLQLNANVSHLKGQIALASALIQAKEATISAQSSEIATLREKIDLRGYLPHHSHPPVTDSESIIEGVLAVKPLETKGIVLDLPNILRSLKRRL